jgi:hypothetical protein
MKNTKRTSLIHFGQISKHNGHANSIWIKSVHKRYYNAVKILNLFYPLIACTCLKSVVFLKSQNSF